MGRLRRPSTLRLRKGMKWHDGKPVTIDDVIFSFQAPMGDNGAHVQALRFHASTSIDQDRRFTRSASR